MAVIVLTILEMWSDQAVIVAQHLEHFIGATVIKNTTGKVNEKQNRR